jgi:hypothetical protein
MDEKKTRQGSFEYKNGELAPLCGMASQQVGPKISVLMQILKP